MGKWPVSMIFLVSSLLFLLQTLQVVNADKCFGGYIDGKGIYAQNRRKLFSNISNEVVSNGGFFSASVDNNPHRVYALALCARGYDRQACINCVEKFTQDIQNSCFDRMDSFVWGSDDADDVSCLVRSSSQSIMWNLERTDSVVNPSQESIEPSKNLMLFLQEWEVMVNRNFEAATNASTTSVLKYYSAERAEFTEFPNVYMLMQCTPDLPSQDCKQCLGDCVTYFRKDFPGRKGGMAAYPNCIFRWDLYAFYSAFRNVTRVPTPPRCLAQDKGSSITEKKGRSISNGGIIAIIVPTCINLLVFIGLIKLYARRRKSISRTSVGKAEYSDFDGQFMLRYDLDMILLATNDFSSENTIGQGGFGTVYKGTLPNGQEIAVKRLTRGSMQGNMEFKNEVSLLTRLQHKNLVKLLGFCNEGDEEVLVYEFVPNSSLDHFIFDEEKRPLLTWKVRCGIVQGIARGLLYLHEDSQLKVIHRDLKAGNILLDEKMNPKVADFGTARLFETDETRAETKRIAGTRGYMAPEYLNHGRISVKSDVFSFGVMLLEMISGAKNSSFERGLAVFAWTSWVQGKPESIIDHFLIENPKEEIIKCIQIGLLCVQENAAKRPTMNSIIVWLFCETVIIPLPNAPPYIGSQCQFEEGTMSMSDVFTELSSR